MKKHESYTYHPATNTFTFSASRLKEHDRRLLLTKEEAEKEDNKKA